MVARTQQPRVRASAVDIMAAYDAAQAETPEVWIETLMLTEHVSSIRMRDVDGVVQIVTEIRG